jgi:hypothetical protein
MVLCLFTDECEFTLDMCGWINDETDTEGFDWQRGKNGDPLQGTGPKVDHTWGTATGKLNAIKLSEQNSTFIGVNIILHIFLDTYLSGHSTDNS